MKTIVWTLAIVVALAGWVTDAEARFVGDLNADGTVNVLDDTLLRRELAGLVSSSSVYPDVTGTYSGSGTQECPTVATISVSLFGTVTQVGGVLSATGTTSSAAGTEGFSFTGFVTPDGTIHGVFFGSATNAVLIVGNLDGNALHLTGFITNNILTATEHGVSCTLRITINRS